MRLADHCDNRVNRHRIYARIGELAGLMARPQPRGGVPGGTTHRPFCALPAEQPLSGRPIEMAITSTVAAITLISGDNPENSRPNLSTGNVGW